MVCLEVMETKPTFEESYPQIEQLVERRRHEWAYVSIMEWADVKQELIIHLGKKWNLYDPVNAAGDPAKKLEKWVNTVVSNQIQNLIRDKGGRRYARPCIGGGKASGIHCAYNLGGDSCSAPWVKSKTQCAECSLFAEWEKTRRHQHNIKSSVTLENHTQEVNNMPGDFVDYEGIKAKIDKLMLEQLTRWEGKIYKLLFVQFLPPMEVSKKLVAAAARRKGPLRTDELTSYQSVLYDQKRFTAMLLEILKREDHIDEEHIQQFYERRK